MPHITTQDGTNLHVKDTGTGSPIVLIHGWPLTGDMWEYQSLALLEAGHRVITYDRRGFGQSGHPAGPYNYDVFADDLAAILDQLDIKGATLVGFSMGGGEVARYLSRHGAGRIARVALISSVVPFLLRTDDNPDGVDPSVFEGIEQAIRKDRFAFLQDFNKQFYGHGLLHKSVSQGVLDWSFTLGIMASPVATIAAARAWSTTDFRPDLSAFTVPTLVIHGSHDQAVPAALTGKRAAEAIAGSTYIEYEGAPHGLFATEHARLNKDLLEFIGG